MRREDIATRLHRYLVPVEGRPNIKALVAPPTPRCLPVGDSGSTALMHAAMQGLGRLDGEMRHWAFPDLLTRTLARREAVQSSQIEGTRTDLDHLLIYEETQAEGSAPPDAQVTERYVQALQIGLDAVRQHGRAGITLELLNRLHAVLMQDAGDAFPCGRYRTEQAMIAPFGARFEQARFIPAPPSFIAPCMEEMERSILQYAPAEEEQGELTVLAQVAIAHAQFETIHPYLDGNGRTGRLLMPLILAAEGYPPLYLSGTLLRNRNAYYDALLQVQLQGRWTPWMDLLCRAVIESVQDAISIARDLQALVETWGRGQRRGSVANRLPALLVGHPVVSARSVAELLGVSLRSALSGIYQLEQAGVLEQTGDARWGRTWRAKAVIERLNQPPAP